MGTLKKDELILKSSTEFPCSYIKGRSEKRIFVNIPKNKTGNDHYHSITPNVLKSTLNSIKRMKNIYKIQSKAIPTKAEMPALKGARRSLFFTKNLKKVVDFFFQSKTSFPLKID